MESAATLSSGTANRLRLWNLIAGTAHAVQAALVLFLTNDFTIPITASFLEGPPGSTPTSTTTLFDFSVGIGVAGFLALSALAHFAVASPMWFPKYIEQVANNRNYFRWIEYSLSSSLMIVLIAMLPGITDVAALLGLFAANASMILFGWLMEKYESPGKPSWLAYWFGVIAGAVPWLAIAIYLWSPGTSAEPPAFVYGIFFSIFVFFNCFALNMVFQYRQTWKWRRYVFGEYSYIALSLTAKTLLAWQVFSGTLAS